MIFYINSPNLKFLYKFVVIFVRVLYNKNCSREKPTEDGSPTPLRLGVSDVLNKIIDLITLAIICKIIVTIFSTIN